MAKMLAPEQRRNGNYQRVSVMVDGQRRIINLGIMAKNACDSLLSVIAQLEGHKYAGGVLPPDLDKRIGKTSQKFQNELVKVGLIERIERAKTTLSELFDDHCRLKSSTADPKSILNYRSTLRSFEDHFGADFPIANITAGCLENFVADLRKTKQPSTIGNYVKRGNAAFAHAVKHKWINENPFAYVNRSGLQIVKSKAKRKTQNKLLTLEVLERVLACEKAFCDPYLNQEWNALISLVRWTGCRISEALILRWSDIDFDEMEIRIRGKRAGMNSVRNLELRERFSPLWKPLHDLLLSFQASTPKGTVHLFNQIGSLGAKPEFDLFDSDGKVLRKGRWGANIGKLFKDILKRNEIAPWPSPFHAIREFRINELERCPELRIVEVREWTGNSEATAKIHYSNETSFDRKRAASMEWGENGAFKSNQIPSDGIAEKEIELKNAGKLQSDIVRNNLEFQQRDLMGVLVVVS